MDKFGATGAQGWADDRLEFYWGHAKLLLQALNSLADDVEHTPTLAAMDRSDDPLVRG